MAADVHGDIFFDGGYSATPCREYLPRRDDGSWEEGADPRRLLDGTQYGAFEVQLDDNERPVESPDAPCIIPFDEWPQGLSPEEGFLVNANNDTARLSFDGSLHNDRHYIGGPFAPGFRAESIRDGLVELTSSREADIASMSALQGNHRSALGQLAAPALVSAVEEAAALASTDGPLTERQQRIVDILNEDEPGLTEAATRLTDWVASGAMAASGVETFYNPAPSEQETGDAVATMIFNAWLRAFVNAVIEDEPFGDLFTISQRNQVGWLLHDLVAGRGPDNPRGLASWNEEIEASVFLDRTETPYVESFEEVALGALRDALAGLRLPPTEPGVGGFGTSSMSSWLWGLRHQVQFQSFILVYAGDTDGVDLIAGRLGITPDQMPLADGIDESDPRFGLTGFPRPGDYFAVDASHPSLTAPDFHYGYGPVMRMVFALEEGISGVNVTPAGALHSPLLPTLLTRRRFGLATRPFLFGLRPRMLSKAHRGASSSHPESLKYGCLGAVTSGLCIPESERCFG